MQKIGICTLILFNFSTHAHASDVNKETDSNVIPNENFVQVSSDKFVSLDLKEQTAIKIAEAVLSQIYGEQVLNQRPWEVTNNDTDFTIEGVLQEGYRGGVAKIVIRKSDAKIMSYTHGR